MEYGIRVSKMNDTGFIFISFLFRFKFEFQMNIRFLLEWLIESDFVRFYFHRWHGLLIIIIIIICHLSFVNNEK